MAKEGFKVYIYNF